MNSLKNETTVLWGRVLGIGAIHWAITVTWLVYNLYLPELLAQFGFPATLTRTILIIENLLAVGIEPIMGALSDRASQWWSSRMPFIIGGVIVAAATFIIIPVIAVSGASSGIVRWLLPLFFTAWALAMATFRGPSLFLLKKCAANKDLPRAAAILAVLAGFFAAVRPFSTEFILSLGPMAAFAIGSGGLLLGAFVLRQLFPKNEAEPEPESEAKPQVEKATGDTILSELKPYIPTLALIFGVGLGGAWSVRFSTSTVSKLLALQFPEMSVTWLMSIFFFMMMCTALPLGVVAAKIGNHQTMLISLGTAAAGLVLIGLWSNIFILMIVIVLLVAGLNVVTMGAVPFALSLMPSRWGALGVGMYFGGFTFAMGWFHALFSPILDATSPTSVAFLGAGSFLLSWLCISASLNLLPNQKSNLSPQTALTAAGAILVVILLLGWFVLSGDIDVAQLHL